MLDLFDKLGHCDGSIILDAGKNPVNHSYKSLYSEVYRTIEELKALGIKEGDSVGIKAQNSLEWIILDLALIEIRAISVCFPPDQFAELSNNQLVEKYQLALLYTDSPVCEEDQHTLSINDIRNQQAPRVTRSDYRREYPENDLLSIVFSSGTSGYIKELMISRTGTRTLIETMGNMIRFNNDDVILCFLPFSIFQQRWMYFLSIYFDFSLVLTSQIRVINALKAFRPTIIAAPPIFYEAIFERYLAQEKYKRVVAESFANSLDYLLLGSALRRYLKKRIFKGVHEIFGGKMRIMLVGAAPSKLSMLRFYNIAGLPLYEGYGMTETGYISLNTFQNNKVGSKGRLLYKDSVFFSDDNEIIYKSKSPLCVGYLNDDDANRDTFIGDNKVATGDIGYIDKDGYLYLEGRKKTLILTSNGIKIHPEIIESRIESSELVKRAVVFKDSMSNNLKALVSVASNQAEVKSRISDLINSINQESKGQHRITDVIFTQTEFTTDNGILNRNLKINRKAATKLFTELQGIEE